MPNVTVDVPKVTRRRAKRDRSTCQNWRWRCKGLYCEGPYLPGSFWHVDGPGFIPWRIYTHLSFIYLWKRWCSIVMLRVKMAMFHSYMLVYQRVPHFGRSNVDRQRRENLLRTGSRWSSFKFIQKWHGFKAKSDEKGLKYTRVIWFCLRIGYPIAQINWFLIVPFKRWCGQWPQAHRVFYDRERDDGDTWWKNTVLF